MTTIVLVTVINQYHINGLHLFWDTLYYPQLLKRSLNKNGYPFPEPLVTESSSRVMELIEIQDDLGLKMFHKKAAYNLVLDISVRNKIFWTKENYNASSQFSAQRTVIVYRKVATITLVYKNISFLFIYLETSKWLRERERESRPGTAKIYTISSGLHFVLIHLQKSLLLRASFTGAWYRAAFQPGCLKQRDSANWLLSLLRDHRLFGVEKFPHYIFFGRLHILSSVAPPTQFTWRFLFTPRESCISCFEIPKLTGLSKVNI